MSKSEDKCLVCQNRALESLCRIFSAYSSYGYRKIVICRNCGHIQVYPLFTEQEHTDINKCFFGNKYLIAGEQNPDNATKEDRLSSRLSLYIRERLNVLDIGAGEGWAMDYFQKNNCHYFAIEAVDKLAESAEKRGATVIGKSLFDDYPDYEHFFDIVILRHVLEHMLNPSDALSKIKCFLNSDGLIYLALPNAGNFSVKKGFRTSFLRPIHISYFCQGNVLRLTHNLGLKVICSQADGELFFLLKPGTDSSFQSCNHYEQQKKLFCEQYRKAFWLDNYKIAKLFIRNILEYFILHEKRCS